jgi:hypothetical protein
MLLSFLFLRGGNAEMLPVTPSIAAGEVRRSSGPYWETP